MFQKPVKAILLASEIYSTYPVSIKRFAGHSKWANIRHVKAQKDSERAKLFTRLGRQIKVAVQEGGSSNPSSNLRLAQIIDQAKRINMPVASIQSVIKSMQKDKNQSKSHVFEIKGPGGCIILCEVFTPHLHSLKQNMATILKKNHGKFSDGGATKHLFEQKGVVETELPPNTSKENALDAATAHAIECEVNDVKLMEEVGCLQFICEPAHLNKVQTGLEKFGYKITSASVEYLPHNVVTLSDSEMEQCATLLEKLENLDDVVRLYDNIA